MGLFGRTGNPPPSAPARPVDPNAPVTLDPTSSERLRSITGGDGQTPLFTSDLSVNEFVLVEAAGFQPLGMVMGSSVYHIGFQAAGWKQSTELTVLTQAMYNARELAMNRMEAEASALGADGVVGVRLDMRFYEGGTGMAEFVAIGTAVKDRANPGSLHRFNGLPFTSDLSGQDVFTLRKAGYVPVSLVLGTCVYHIAHQGFLQTLGQIGQNVELPLYTQAVYDARELAMSRMQAEAHHEQAVGIVGVKLVEQNHIWGHHAVEFFAVGTAVRPSPDGSRDFDPEFVLGLGD